MDNPVFIALGLAVLLLSGVLILVLYAFGYARAALSHVRYMTEGQLSPKEIVELSAEVTDLRDLYTSLLGSHKKLRSRIAMRQNRGKGGRRVADRGDIHTDEAARAAYKAELRESAKSRGLLR